ncbi:MAG: Ig-like domain-containing protein [Thermoplasmatota archaeon]
MKLGRMGVLLLLLSIILAIPGIPSFWSGPPSRASIVSPSLQEGTYLEWTYSEWSPDGTSSRTGVQTASVSAGTWNSMDVFIVSGTIYGEFTTPDGSGDESGTWEAIHRQNDLSVVRSTRELTRTVDGSGITGTNRSSTDHDLPYFRWVKFPLKADDPETSWMDEVRSITSWTLSSDGTTIDSGTSDETYVHWRFCSNETTLDLGNEVFDVHVVRERKEKEDMTTVHNSTLYYSDEAGWWIKWETYAPYESDVVKVRELVLRRIDDNRPPVASDIPDVNIDEDEVYTGLDPKDHFSDPDGDVLDFAAVDTGQLEVDIDGDSVVIIPPRDASGTFVFNLTATDRRHDPVRSEVTVIVRPMDDPVELIEGSVDPSEGSIDTEYLFTLTLRDVEGDAPVSVEVSVSGSRHRMSHDDGDFLTGASFTWTGSLPEGEHSFHFEVDGVRLPEFGEYDGPVVSSPEDPILYGPSLDSEEGNTDTDFTYTIYWKDPGGRMPDDVYLFVDDGEELVDSMFLVESGADPSSGVEFRITVTLPTGSHSYYFVAEMNDITVRYPRNGELIGPDVFDPLIEYDGFTPEDPEDGDDVTFFVHYRYGLGAVPDVQKVIVDGDEYTLDIESGDPIDGMNLTRKVRLDKGTHTFRFEIEVDDRRIVTEERTMRVYQSSAADDDDAHIDIEPSKGSGPGLFALIIVILLLVGLGVAALVLVRYKPGKKRQVGYEDDEASEGHVDNVRGL